MIHAGATSNAVSRSRWQPPGTKGRGVRGSLTWRQAMGWDVCQGKMSTAKFAIRQLEWIQRCHPPLRANGLGGSRVPLGSLKLEN